MKFKSDLQRRAAFSKMNSLEKSSYLPKYDQFSRLNSFSKKGSTWLVFGDSIAMGFNDPKGGWVQKLRERVYPDPVYDLSISGDDVNDISDRIISESKKRLKSGDNAKLIVAAGINDTTDNSPKGAKYDLEELFDNVESFMDKKNITVVGLTPVDDSKTHPVAWDDELSYDGKAVSKFDNSLKEACEKEGVKFISLEGKLDLSDLDDGLHPNASGHDKIFKVVKDEEGL